MKEIVEVDRARDVIDVARRSFMTNGLTLTSGAVTALALGALPSQILANPSQSALADLWTRDRVIWLRRPQSGEQLRAMYFADGKVHWDTYALICHMLRDVEEKTTFLDFDINLLNLVYGIQAWDEAERRRPYPFDVHSGFRTVAHNRRLESDGAARNSLHMQRRALDGEIFGMHHSQLAQKGEFYQLGGVGLYSWGVHLDTGAVRRWRRAKVGRLIPDLGK